MSKNNFINQIKKTVYSEDAGEAIANPSETNDIELTADAADTGAGSDNTDTFTKDEVKKEFLKFNRNVNQLIKNTNKTFAILGDSVSAFPGYMPEIPYWDPENYYGRKEPEYYLSWYLEGGHTQGKNAVTTVDDMWWAQVADQANLSMICNSSWSGTCIGRVPDTCHSFIDRAPMDFGECRANTSSPDYLFILGGANDITKNAEAGGNFVKDAIKHYNEGIKSLHNIPNPVPYDYWLTKDKQMLQYTLPAFCYLIGYLKHYNPNTKIYNIILNNALTTKNLNTDVPDGMRIIGKMFGIKSIEIPEIPGREDDGKYINSGHPTTEGQRLIANKVISALNFDSKYGVPYYWQNAIDNLSDKLIPLQDNAGAKAFQFIWLSDIHGISGYDNAKNKGGYINTNIEAGKSKTTDIGKIAQYTAEKYNIPFVAISGDILSQYSHNKEEYIYEEYQNMDKVLAPIDSTKLLAVKGDYDGSWGATYLNSIGADKIYNCIYRRQATDRQRVFGGDGTYFYVDSPQNIRFIMLNSQTEGDSSTDDNGHAVYNSQKNSVYGTEQLKWLADVALDMPQGYKAIIMAHEPLSQSKDGKLLAGIIDAYNNNNKPKFNGSVDLSSDGWGNDATNPEFKTSSANADFANAKGEVIAFFHGHIHKDTVDTESYSFPCISITTAGGNVCDENSDKRVPNTVTETAMDIVTIDMKNRKIHTTRLGAGSDRLIPLSYTVDYNVGEHITIDNKSGTVKQGNSFEANLTIDDNYSATVTVFMGGENITATAYSNGKISIANVTGNITITATVSLV